MFFLQIVVSYQAVACYGRSKIHMHCPSTVEKQAVKTPGKFSHQIPRGHGQK